MPHDTLKTAATLAALALANAASATDLSNNLANTVLGNEPVTSTRLLCASFATDTSTHALSSVTLRLGNSQVGDAVLALYTNAGLEPGVQIAALSAPSSFPASPGLVTFSAAGTITLSANTTYWLVLRPTAGLFEWTFSDNTNGSGAGWQGQWGVNDATAPTLWWTQDSYPLAMQVVVDACTGAAVTSPPAGLLLCTGQTASFTVAASGTGTLTYQWRRGTADLSDGPTAGGSIISGTSSPTLTISGVGASDAGAYSALVTNSCGNAASAGAILSINSADFNNDGDVGTDADIEAFFACLAGSCCATCGSADFNADGDVGTDADIEAFFRVLGGGAC